MARVIVMPNATNLEQGVSGKVLLAERVDPTKLEDEQALLESLEEAALEFLERLVCAITPARRSRPSS